MRLSIVAAVATFSATAFAQGNLIGNIPSCAQACFGTDNLGTCNLIDVGCICKSQAITDVACCVLSSCSQSDIENTIKFASSLCSSAGVTLNTSPNCSAANSSSSASSSASAASASASASGSASVTAISGTNTPSGSATRSASGTASGTASAATATGAGAFQTAGPVLGLGVAVVGLLAAL